MVLPVDFCFSPIVPILCANIPFLRPKWMDEPLDCCSKLNSANRSVSMKTIILRSKFNPENSKTDADENTYKYDKPNDCGSTEEVEYRMPTFIVMQKITRYQSSRNGSHLNDSYLLNSILKFWWPADVLTCPPPNTNDPNLLLSVRGIHDASNALNAGKVVPSPRPISARNMMRAVAPPLKQKTHHFRYPFDAFQWVLLNPHQKSSPHTKHLPCSTQYGVIRVNIAVDKMPKDNVYLPPNRSASTPPGRCVST